MKVPVSPLPAQRGMDVIQAGHWLVVHLSKPHQVLSWAVVRGGRVRAQSVAWYQVSEADLAPPAEPADFLRARLEEADLHDAVGFLTSGNLTQYCDVEKRAGDFSARCVATVGLSNALRVGDPPGRFESVKGPRSARPLARGLNPGRVPLAGAANPLRWKTLWGPSPPSAPRAAKSLRLKARSLLRLRPPGKPGAAGSETSSFATVLRSQRMGAGAAGIEISSFDPALQSQRKGAGAQPTVGTINLLCLVSHPLSEEGLIEALSLASEARTLAVLEADAPSLSSGLPSTGTGTDCVAVASPEGPGDEIRYAGKHTVLGHLIGGAVLEAVRKGTEKWKQKR